MESQNKLFEEFKAAAAADEQTTFLAQDKLWGRIEQQLDKQYTRKIQFFSFAAIKYAAAALVLITGIAVGWNQFFGVQSNENKLALKENAPVQELAGTEQPALLMPAKNDPAVKPVPAKRKAVTVAAPRQQQVDHKTAVEGNTPPEPHFALAHFTTAPESFGIGIEENATPGSFAAPVLTEPFVYEKSHPATDLAEARVLKLQGVIVDKAGVALANAKVSVPGTDKVVTSDNKGLFALEVPDTAQFIIVQSYGNETKYVKVAERHNYKIEISPEQSNVALLNDIARYNSGNGMQNLYAAPMNTTSIRQELAGRQKQQAMLRQAPSADPLIIVNGVPFSGKFSDINSRHIKEVKILPDANARALYGERAKNGVIIITLKKGKSVSRQ